MFDGLTTFAINQSIERRIDRSMDEVIYEFVGVLIDRKDR